MLEQDLASIMRFLTEKSGSPAPYYTTCLNSSASRRSTFPGRRSAAAATR